MRYAGSPKIPGMICIAASQLIDASEKNRNPGFFSPPDDPYRNVVINGRAVAIEQRGMDLIDHMARKYTDADKYQWSQPGEVRVDIAVEVDRITG